jgi:hypothetical protein
MIFTCLFIIALFVPIQAYFTLSRQTKSIFGLGLQLADELSELTHFKVRDTVSRFEEEFEDYNDHLPQFLKVGLSPRPSPDFPMKLRKQYKTMFGGTQLSPPQRKQSSTTNKELKAGKSHNIIILFISISEMIILTDII